MKRLFLAPVLTLLGLFSSYAAQPYPPEAHSTLRIVTVTVIWLPDYPTVDAVCAALSYETPQGNILGCFFSSTNTIYAVEPKSFNDLEHLLILGHEFWHALGAEHP